MRITFLVRNIWGIGGTIKTTVNTVDALADRGHDVRIVSCVRPRPVRGSPLDSRVAGENLMAGRKPEHGGERLSPLDRWRRRRPSIMDDERINSMGESSKLLDRRVAACLHRIDTDVLVGTHASLNLYIARYAPRHVPTVGQEHLYLGRYRRGVRERLLSGYRALDAIVTVTEGDAQDYRDAMPDYSGRVECVPNSIPAPSGPAPTLTEPVVMAAGRLTGTKGFDVLIKAFARVADRHPDWELRIFGRGPRRADLERLIEEQGLTGRARLMGPVSPLDAEWAKASIAVVPSKWEAFGLVIVEAMAAGLPVVGTAVERGPLELIDDEVNGLLVKPKSPKSLAAALARLMDDPALRRKLAAGGSSSAERYRPERVVALHERLFTELTR
jgi:glycosyltransferase involved in cell wall biosynthesis